MTNLDSTLKSRDITLLTKVHLVKALVFPVVIYGCESWTIKKAESQRIDAFELWCWRRLLRVPWTARRSNKSILKEISPEYSLKRLMLKLNLQNPVKYVNWLIGKDRDAGKDFRWEEKGTAKNEMVGWHHQLNGYEFGQAVGIGPGQGSLVCYIPWGHKESDTTEWMNWYWMNWYWFIGRTDGEAETPLATWCNELTHGKYPDIRKDWRQNEKGVAENEMIREHHWYNGHKLSKLQETVEDNGAWSAAVHGVTKSHTDLATGQQQHTVYPGSHRSCSSENPPANEEMWVQSQESGRSPPGGNGNPLQYSCLENSMDRVAWWAIVYESQRAGHVRATEDTHTYIQYIIKSKMHFFLSF